MQMTNISIKGCAAFAEQVDFPLSSIVAIQGKNRQGKSALLACIKYPFQSGHDPDMVNGEEGEIVITFDDGTMVRATVAKDKTDRMTKTAGATKWARGRKFIDDIANAISFDPLAFLRLKEREQVETLLKIMPVEVKTEELTDAIKGFEVEAAEACQSAPNSGGLETINLIRGRIFGDRTRVNVEADTYEKHAATLAQGLKDLSLIEGADWEKEVKRLQAEGSDLAAGEEREQAALRESFIATKADLDKQFYAECAEVDRDINEQIVALEEKRAAANRASKEHADEAVDKLKRESATKRDEISKRFADDKTRVASDLAVAQVRAEQKQKASGQEDAMSEAKKEAAARRSRSQAMTAAIARLDEVKRSVASRMDIKGIDISDGRICREENGNLVPIGKWNESDALLFVLRIAVLAHGKAGFICIDGAECLDPERRKGLFKTAQKYAVDQGLQFVIATVGEGPLSVTDGASQ